MSCSIPSIRIIIFEHNMQLKIIIQNKLKGPKPAFLKNVLVFFPEVALFCVYAYSVTSSALFNFMVSPPVEGGLQWLIQCVLQSVLGKSKRKRAGEFFFFFFCLLSSWYEGRVKGRMWQCWFPLPWDMSWCVAGLCADTWGPLCFCFSGSISSVLWTEGN